MFPSNFLYEFFTLLVILDPIATVPVFLAVSYGLKWRDALKVALTALAVAFGILTTFIFLGLEFLKALDIPTSSFQLAGSLPSIAGAGAILTVVMLSDNSTRVISEQLQTTFVVLLCLSVHLLTFMAGGLIIRYIGMIGIQITTRVFGLMICSIAVTGMVIAIKESFGLG
jgi:multiple antibiotic resistance protein